MNLARNIEYHLNTHLTLDLFRIVDTAGIWGRYSLRSPRHLLILGRLGDGKAMRRFAIFVQNRGCGVFGRRPPHGIDSNRIDNSTHAIPPLQRSSVRPAVNIDSPLPRRIDVSFRNGSVRVTCDAGSTRPINLSVVRFSTSPGLRGGTVYAGFSEIDDDEGQSRGLLFRPYTGSMPLLLSSHGERFSALPYADRMTLPQSVFAYLVAYLRSATVTGFEQSRVRLRIDPVLADLPVVEVDEAGLMSRVAEPSLL